MIESWQEKNWELRVAGVTDSEVEEEREEEEWGAMMTDVSLYKALIP